jgi:hypothetical protein
MGLGTNLGVAGAAATTYSAQWELESDYDMVRLVYFNTTAASWAIPIAKVSPSSMIGDGHSPANAAGAADFTMFQPITFNNAGLNVAPQDQALWGTGTTTFTIPANAGPANRMQFWFSDWTRVSSLARTDGGTYPLLMVRQTDDATSTFHYVAFTRTTWNAAVPTRQINPWLVAGDKVTAPSVMTGAAQFNQLPIAGIQYMTRRPGFSVLAVGESWTQGVNSSTNFDSFGLLSVLNLSTPDRPISFWNQGWSGQLASDFWANGIAAFKASLPDVVLINGWSPNGGLTQAVADDFWSRAMDFAHYAMKAGAVPVLWAGLPWYAITGPQETIRVNQLARLQDAKSHGFAVLDFESLMGTGASPNAIKPALLSLSVPQGHPNDAGYALMDSAVFRPVLANILRA